jgi:hypothetical protein
VPKREGEQERERGEKGVKRKKERKFTYRGWRRENEGRGRK